MGTKLPVSLFLLIVATGAAAFDVDGFTSGMTKEAARRRATETMDRVVWGENDVYGGSSRTRQEFVVLKFCDDKLVDLSVTISTVPNTIANLSLLVDERVRMYGQPVKVEAKSFSRHAMIGGGMGRTLDFHWMRGEETVRLSVSGANSPQSGKTDGLFVESFSVRNRCGIPE